MNPPSATSIIRSPYGSWRSPITSQVVSKSSISLQHVSIDGDNIYWIEGRPDEGGRSVVVRRDADGRTTDITPAHYNARTRAHEYGGGALLVSQGTVYFSNFTDGIIYRQTGSGNPEPLTQVSAFRYADFILDQPRNRLICVREDHHSNNETVNQLVEISLDGSGAQTVLVSGADFYSTPRLNSTGDQLAWISWNHPNFPWTRTEVWTGTLDGPGNVLDPRRIAGAENESIFQPEWSPDGVLYFISDRSGWWNFYRDGETGIEALLPMEAEFGRAQWVFGMSTYGFRSNDEIICSYFSKGRGNLAQFDLKSRSLTRIPSSYINFSQVRVSDRFAVVLAGAPDQPHAVVKLDLADLEKPNFNILCNSSPTPAESGLADYISNPEFIEFPSRERTAFGWYYPPRNPVYGPLPDEIPPLLVICHGGPTASAPNVLVWKIQFWTSRGYAVLDVDYGGSTGYGTQYRNLLHKQWGIVDVEDCISGVAYLVAKKLADPKRVMISGGSAGGYTVLRALTTSGSFQSGASHYGVSDVVKLALETHKFESRYMDWLIGKYPEEAELYQARSPIHATDQLQAPVIFFQGDDDKIVLPNQTELMVEAIRAKGLPVGYFLFKGEGHGFRKAENIQRALDAELYFYSSLVVKSGLTF